MNPVVISLPNDTSGDTWKGATIGPVLVNGARPRNSLVSCTLCFYYQSNNALAYAFRSTPLGGEGIIVIVDSINWLIRIDPQVRALPDGKYVWFFVAIDSAGIRETYYTGVIEIKKGSPNG